jgi:hypothetical protein
MSSVKTKAPSKENIESLITRDLVEKQLENALLALKEAVGEKKFKQRIKKAAKLLVHGLKKKTATKAAATKKAVAKPIAKNAATKVVKKAEKLAKKAVPAKKVVAKKAAKK